ncbi:MAG: hypothetical protein ABIY35_04580 [Chitinophagaceae bacterium]
MIKDQNNDLFFLNEKIQEIGNALFFPGNGNHFRYPASIINIARTDETGNLWFYMYQPWASEEVLQNDFPVKMDFFRKGKDFSIKVEGTATIHQEADKLVDVPQWMSSIKSKNFLLVRVKMCSAEYFDFNHEPSLNLLKKIKISWNNWMYSLKPHYKLFRFNRNNQVKEEFSFI